MKERIGKRGEKRSGKKEREGEGEGRDAYVVVQNGDLEI